MRIYEIDGLICFDTDDPSEASLLDRFEQESKACGVQQATSSIAAWLSERGEADVRSAEVLAEIAERIRAGAWCWGP